jgi:hypothetical protein
MIPDFSKRFKVFAKSGFEYFQGADVDSAAHDEGMYLRNVGVSIHTHMA